MPQRSALAEGWPVWALALGQTLSYASLFYSFAALIFYWHRDLGWAKSTLALGPFVAILISAGLGPFVGKLVDKGRGPESMVFGALMGASSLIAMSYAQTPAHWMMAWAIQGISQALSQYEACFAFLIRRLGPAARKAIIRVTLVAGFAGTISIPAYAALAELMGWRSALWVGAGIVTFIVVPLNYFATRAIRRHSPPPQPKAPTAAQAPNTQSRRSKLILLSVIFTLLGLNQWMILHFLVPIFVLQGYTEAEAIFAASLIGPAQVVGRLVLMRYEARLDTRASIILTVIGLVVAAMILWAAGFGFWVVLSYVVLQGSAVGMLTILRPLYIAEVMGAEGYGVTAGKIQVSSSTVGAFAPMVGALFLEGPGLNALIIFSLMLSLATLLCFKALKKGAP